MTEWASGDANDYYALRVAVGKERKVQEILEVRGVENQVPMRETPGKSRYVSNPAPVLRPALTGFVFIAFDKGPLVSQPWERIQNCHLIFGPVGIKKTPVKLKHKDLVRFFDDLVFSDLWEPKPHTYTVNEDVKIVVGPFAGFPATVAEAGETELRLLTYIFGRPTPVSVPRKHLDWIEPVAA